jgi:hypothetical protein
VLHLLRRQLIATFSRLSRLTLLVASLQQQMMQQFFQGMQQSLQNMTPEDIA